MERGYVKLWRKVEDNRSWSRGVLHRALMMTLLVRASWKANWFHGREIKPGQLATSVRTLADDLGAPRSSVHRAIQDLVDDGMITVEKVGHEFSIVSLVNWNSYQQTMENSGTRLGQGRDANGTQTGQSKELKKVKTRNDSSNEESIPEASANPSGTQALLVPFRPSEPALVEIPLTKGEVFRVTGSWVAEMQTAYPDVDIVAEMKKCRAWCLNNTKKTSNGVKKFLNSWLSKAQNGARRVRDDSPEAQGWHLI